MYDFAIYVADEYNVYVWNNRVKLSQNWLQTGIGWSVGQTASKEQL